MSDTAVVATAVLCALAALGAPGIPVRVLLVVAVMCLAVLCIAVLSLALTPGRRPGPRGRPVRAVVLPLAAAALVASAVGLRASQDLAGLARATPPTIDGTGELASDPQRTDFGTQVELFLDGRRYLATVGREHEAVVLPLGVGDRIQVRGSVRPMRGAPPGWLRSRHLAGRLALSQAASMGGTRAWFRAANEVHTLLERGAASMSEQHRSLYLGLVVGDDRNQDDYTGFRFRAAGLTHLLAVSGQNLVFVMTALSPLTVRVTLRWRWILGSAAIAGFVLVTRAEPSVMRAAVMAVIGLTAAVTGRSAPGVRVLGLAVILLLIGDPMLVESVGFRLSVAATGGLVLLSRPIARALPGPDWLVRPLAVTLAAQMGAVPVMAMTFGAVSVLAVPANLVAEPAAALVMTAGMTSGLLAGVVREDLAVLVQAPVRAGVWWVDGVATVTSAMSARPVGALGWSATAALALLAAALWRRRGAAAVGRALLVALLPWVLLIRPPSPGHVLVGVPEGVALVHVCGTWMLDLGEQKLGDRAAVDVVESLWQSGLRRVGWVTTDAEGGSAPELARWMRARFVHPAPDGSVLPDGSVPPDEPVCAG